MLICLVVNLLKISSRYLIDESAVFKSESWRKNCSEASTLLFEASIGPHLSFGTEADVPLPSPQSCYQGIAMPPESAEGSVSFHAREGIERNRWTEWLCSHLSCCLELILHSHLEMEIPILFEISTGDGNYTG